MKICTWNCNGAFYEKWKVINDVGADIFVIQECEKPKNKMLKEFTSHYLWTGVKNKGVGIFVRDGIVIEENNWESFGLEWFISCSINNESLLIGLWGCRNYIEDINLYLRIHDKRIKNYKNIVVCGDFNSNSMWDKQHIRRSHSDAVSLLKEYGIESCYHNARNEQQGCELTPTFYMYRKRNRPYHIDYIFANQDKVGDVQVGEYDKWIKYSDHMPIIAVINDKDGF